MATTSRVSTYSYTQQVISDYSQSQSALVDMQRQVSSGKIARTFEDLSGRVEKVNALENKRKNLAHNTNSNNQILSNLETSGKAVDDIIDATDDILSLMIQAKSATQAQYPLFAAQLKTKMDNIGGLLNNNIGGRYLFSGGKTNTAPVTIPVPASFAIGVPDSNYYNGDDEVLTARVTETFLLPYGVRANQDGFKNLFAAINQSIEGLKANAPTIIDAAITLLNTSAEDINAIKSDINANIATINESNAFLDATQAYVLGIYGTETSADTVALSTQIATQQSVLQASFQVFARISGLKLSDYLR
jgi:flagellar hook-associated protein 3 FlgL